MFNLVIERRANRLEPVASDGESTLGGSIEKPGKKVARRSVLPGRGKLKLDAGDLESLEQEFEALVLNPPRKGAAAHHPGFDFNSAVCLMTLNHRDGTQPAKPILVLYREQEGRAPGKFLLPFSGGDTDSIQVELIRLINQLKNPGIREGNIEIEGEPGLDIPQEVAGATGFRLFAEFRPASKAVQAKPVLIGYAPVDTTFGKQVSNLF